MLVSGFVLLYGPIYKFYDKNCPVITLVVQDGEFIWLYGNVIFMVIR